jgi:hypothetical protein
MKRLVVLAVLALAVVPGAAAKAPPNGFRVCGASACVAITGNDAEHLAIRMFYSSWSTRWNAPPSSSPFYRLHWAWDTSGPVQTAYYVPSANAVHVAPETYGRLGNPFGWAVLEEESRAILSSLTSSLDPVPGATPAWVTVGGKLAKDPESYAVLWSVGKPAFAWPRSGWLLVRIVTNVSSPWSGDLSISRRGTLLMRDETIFRIPRTLAKRVRARVSLRG